VVVDNSLEHRFWTSRYSIRAFIKSCPISAKIHPFLAPKNEGDCYLPKPSRTANCIQSFRKSIGQLWPGHYFPLFSKQLAFLDIVKKGTFARSNSWAKRENHHRHQIRPNPTSVQIRLSSNQIQRKQNPLEVNRPGHSWPLLPSIHQ
jgi:hypothetical protein